MALARRTSQSLVALLGRSRIVALTNRSAPRRAPRTAVLLSKTKADYGLTQSPVPRSEETVTVGYPLAVDLTVEVGDGAGGETIR
jgi:hypothetical protein